MAHSLRPFHQAAYNINALTCRRCKLPRWSMVRRLLSLELWRPQVSAFDQRVQAIFVKVGKVATELT